MYNIKEFCKFANISERYFHIRQAQGTGPVVTRMGRRVLVSFENAVDWLTSQESRAV